MNNKKVRIAVIAVLGLVLLIVVTIMATKFRKASDAVNVEENNALKEIVVQDEVVIRMVGDSLIHDPIYRTARTENGYDFSMLFENVKRDIQESDIAIINQETIFVDDPKQYSSYPTFGTPKFLGHAIVDAGFDVVCHATNHTNDKGSSGINDTLNFWSENYPDMKVLGIHASKEESDVTYIEKNNIKFAFVNYTYGLNGLNLPKEYEYMVDLLGDKEAIKQTLQEAEQNADVLIPILHIGTEYVYEPSTYHKNYVEFFIDNGADIVLCAHPHVLEPFGIVTTKEGNSALVYYSLGNFTSNQHELPRMLGGMADIKVKRENGEIKIASFDLIPLVTHFENGYYTTYKLSDYTEELASKHGINKYCEFSLQGLKDLYEFIIEKSV